MTLWRMPNVLFVATGRNLVDWYDETRANLHAVGRATWPGLVPGATAEPRQHLVGMLAMEDRLRVIARAREIYSVEVSDNVAHELALASGGLPQYLDMALALALTRKQNGGFPITVGDVTVSLRALVELVLEDVPNDEQRALRAAALFPFFDAHIVAMAAGVDDGCARRAILRPMIDRRGSEAFPYSMHDAIRNAIRHSGHSIKNGWSDQDWLKAGELGLEAVRARYESASTEHDSPTALEALGLAIGLVSEQELSIGPAKSPNYEDWLSQAVVFGPSIAGLRSSLPTSAKTDLGRGYANFILSRTAEVTVDQAAELLTGVFESPHPLRISAGRHRGYVLRNAARWEDAAAAFNDLVAAAPTDLNRYQRVLTFATARRFAEALDATDDLPDNPAKSIRMFCAVGHARVEGYTDVMKAQHNELREKGARGRRSKKLEVWFAGEHF